MEIEVDPRIIREITGRHERFPDPFAAPESYTIVEAENAGKSEAARGLYLERLRYAAAHADTLIAGAFRREFYDFYGVDRSRVTSPEEMCRGLVFDSFVLDMRNANVGTCLTNPRFMFGHFIECWWDDTWKLISLGIC